MGFGAIDFKFALNWASMFAPWVPTVSLTSRAPSFRQTCFRQSFSSNPIRLGLDQNGLDE